MRKYLCSIAIVLSALAALLPMQVRAAGNDGFRLDEGGTVTVVSQHAAKEEISSLGFSLSVESADASKVEFQFEESRAEILEFRYDEAAKRLNVYVAGTEALFAEGADALKIGKIVALDASGRETAAQVSVVEDSLQYVYGTELKTMQEVDLPGTVQIGSTGQKPSTVTPAPAVTPATPADPQLPAATQSPANPQLPTATQSPAEADYQPPAEEDWEEPNYQASAVGQKPSSTVNQKPSSAQTSKPASKPQAAASNTKPQAATTAPQGTTSPSGSIGGSSSEGSSQVVGSEPQPSDNGSAEATPASSEEPFLHSPTQSGGEDSQRTDAGKESKGTDTVFVIAIIAIVIVVGVLGMAFVVLKKPKRLDE